MTATKQPFCILLQDAIGNRKAWHYNTLYAARLDATRLPAAGWKLVSIMRWTGNEWKPV